MPTDSQEAHGTSHLDATDAQADAPGAAGPERGPPRSLLGQLSGVVESDQLHDDSHLAGGVRFRVGNCTVRPWKEPVPPLKRLLVRSKDFPEAANDLWPVRRRHNGVRAKRVLPDNSVTWLVHRPGIAPPGPPPSRRLAPRAQSPCICGARAVPAPGPLHRGLLPPRGPGWAGAKPGGALEPFPCPSRAVRGLGARN